MPLEFALRPHFDLARSTSRKRKRPRTFARLAVPVAAYWLAIAGATHAFIASTHDRPPRAPARPASTHRTERHAAPTLPDADEPVAPAQAVAEPAPSSPPFTAVELPPEPSTTPNPAQKARMEPALRVAVLPVPALAAPAPSSRPLVAPPADALPAPPRSGIAHAGPRIEDPFAALTDPAPRRDDSPGAPVVTKPEPDELPAISLPSCETAAASAEQSVDFRGSSSTPDLPREAFAAVLDRGGYLARCAIPARTTLDICAAVQDGKVIGVSVGSRPHSTSVDACVRRAVAVLRFPKSPRIDVARTRFEAAR